MRTTDAEGAATIWMAVVCALVMAAASLALTIASVAVARHRAGSAADLAALAAAGRLAAGVPAIQACDAAARVAGDNGAELAACHPDTGGVFVRVRMRLRGVLAPFGAVSAVARAGPASPRAS